MRWWYELKYVMRKRNRRPSEQEAEEEIGIHQDLETREKIEARRATRVDPMIALRCD